MSKATRVAIIGEGGHLANLRPFNGNSMRATARPTFASQGQMPHADYLTLSAAIAAGRVAYLVMSYATPIGWVTDGAGEPVTVTVPDVVYSNTTSAHQASCRRWLPQSAPVTVTP